MEVERRNNVGHLRFLAHCRPGGYAGSRGWAAVEESVPIPPTGVMHWPQRAEGGE